MKEEIEEVHLTYNEEDKEEIDEEIDTEEEDGNEEEDSVKEEEAPFKLPLIQSNTNKVSKVPFIPLRASQEIGWRSARPECNLERFGNWARPKKSILKHFNWSLHACP